MKGEKAFYEFLESPLGTLIACTSSKGCFLLEFYDNEHSKEFFKKYQKIYSLNMKEGTSEALQTLKEELKSYFKGELHEFSVPLELRGTTFQKKVWTELLKIPYGETRSYGEISNSIGNPKAVRAVGHANGSNPIPIIIPCHRVIASNGTLHGYGGGIWRKKYLLKLENPNFSFKEDKKGKRKAYHKTLDNWM